MFKRYFLINYGFSYLVRFIFEVYSWGILIFEAYFCPELSTTGRVSKHPWLTHLVDNNQKTRVIIDSIITVFLWNKV